jgi:NADPH2:quinone reductase
MRAIRFHETGGPDVLQLDEVPLPDPKSNEARLKVAVTGVNFIDTYQRSGQYKVALPFTPGGEAAGTIDVVNDTAAAEALGLQVGQRVVTASGGGYAEYMTAPLDKLIPLPDAIDDATAAALMVQGLTAHYLAVSTYPLSDKETVLIHAAAGGAGGLLVQLAKRAGATVIATAGTREKADDVLRLGADHAIVYTEEDFVPAVKEYTSGKGVDVVYDSVGKTTFAGGLDCLRPRGLMVLWGQASGAVPLFDLQTLNAKGSLYITRPSMGAYVRTREELLWRANELFDWVQSGELTVRIDRTFPLAEAADAHRYVEGRNTRGKVLLVP